METARRRALTLPELLVVLVLFIVAVGLLLPALVRVRVEAESVEGRFSGRRTKPLALASPSDEPPAPGHTKDSLDSVKKMLGDDKAVLVDVREQTEWDAGHVRGAVLLPLSELRPGLDPKELASTLPKGKVVYVHCASGRRCLTAADALKKQGYDVRPLRQGFKDLVEAGFPKVGP